MPEVDVLDRAEEALKNITAGKREDVVNDDGELWVLIPKAKFVSEKRIAYFGDMEETDMDDHANARLCAIAPDLIRELVQEVRQLRADHAASHKMRLDLEKS